jgi:hypothetical protein
MKDEVKFKEYVAALCEIHDKTISSLRMSLYWKTLEPFSDEECERAFKELIFSSKFFPKPAHFIELLRGKKEDQATRAWVKVLNAVKRYGNYVSIRFDDPIVHSVVCAMGGWPQLGLMKIEEEKWRQREFERLYEVLSQEGEHPEYLPGICEIENSAKGYDVKAEIVKIGFEDKLRLAG